MENSVSFASSLRQLTYHRQYYSMGLKIMEYYIDPHSISSNVQAL